MPRAKRHVFDVDAKTLADLSAVYVANLEFLEKLPPSRMRALAISALEESHSRAIFAVSEIADSIRMRS